MESNWVDFKTIKRAVTIEQVLVRYGVKLRRMGKELRGRCPIHHGEARILSTPTPTKTRFTASRARQGNVLGLIAAMESCGVRDAALKLCEWFSIAASAQAPSEKRDPGWTG